MAKKRMNDHALYREEDKRDREEKQKKK